MTKIFATGWGSSSTSDNAQLRFKALFQKLLLTQSKPQQWVQSEEQDEEAKSIEEKTALSS